MNTVQTVWHIRMYRYSELNLNQYGVALFVLSAARRLVLI